MYLKLLTVYFFPEFTEMTKVQVILGYVVMSLLTAYVTCAVTSRSDEVSVITPQVNTDWGVYGNATYCNPGTYAVGFNLRTVQNLVEEDDTAVNRIWLTCT